MKKTDLAYIAGLFDGEGCVTYSSRKTVRKDGTSGITSRVLVTMGQTEEYMVRWLQFNWGGTVYIRKPPEKFPHAKYLYVWRILCWDACVFLKDVLPYLKLKKAQAEIALKFHSKLSTTRQGKPRRKTDEELTIDQEFRTMISSLNRKGR